MRFLGCPADERPRNPNSAKVYNHFFACIERRDRDFELPICMIGITSRPLDRVSAYMMRPFFPVTLIRYAFYSSVIRMLEAVSCRHYSSHAECWNVAGGGDWASG